MRLLLGAVFVAGICAPAFADNDADKLFVEGRELLKKGDNKGACEKFHAANAIDTKAPGVMLNLGLCYEGLGKKATSLFWFRKAQTAASEANPRATDYENAAAEKKAKLAAEVATVKIDINGIPSQVDILIDGVLRSREELNSPVELDAGPHTIEGRAPGKTSFMKDLPAKDGDKLGPITIPALKDAPKIAPIGVVKKDHSKLGWVLGIGGIVAAGGATVGAKIIHDKDNGVESEYKGVHKALMYGFGGVTVVGVAAVGLGAYFIITRPKGEERRMAVVPTVAPDGMGLSAVGRF